MKDNEIIFKSYLRRLLHDLKELEDAHKKDDKEKVDKIIKNLIEDTQKGIED